MPSSGTWAAASPTGRTPLSLEPGGEGGVQHRGRPGAGSHGMGLQQPGWAGMGASLSSSRPWA